MAYELIATGNVADLVNLGQYEGQIDEGQKGLLELDLRLPVSQEIASELESLLKRAGIPDVNVVAASPKLRVYFRKGFPWLAVIAAIVLGLIILAVLITGWRLYKDVIPEPVQPVAGLVLVALGVVLLVSLTRRKR